MEIAARRRTSDLMFRSTQQRCTTKIVIILNINKIKFKLINLRLITILTLKSLKTKNK